MQRPIGEPQPQRTYGERILAALLVLAMVAGGVCAARAAQTDDDGDRGIQRAKEVLRTATDPGARNAAYETLEQLYSQDDDDAEVEATFRDHLRDQPSPRVKHNYANFLYRRWRHDEAIDMEKSVLAEADFPAAHKTLAMAYVAKADELPRDSTDERQRLYTLAIEADPSNAQARDVLSTLQAQAMNQAPQLEERPPVRPAVGDRPAALSVDVCIERLRSSDAGQRATALEALRTTPGGAAKPAVQALVALAGNRNGDERLRALLVLARIAPEDPTVVRAAVDTISNSMDETVVKQLLPAVRGLGPAAVAQILEGFAQGRLPRHAAASLILEGADLSKQSRPVVDAAAIRLGVALASPDTVTRINAARTLAALGSGAQAAVPKLTVALADSNPSVRGLAATTLGAIGAPAAAAVAALTKLTGDPDQTVAARARQARDSITQTRAASSP